MKKPVFITIAAALLASTFVDAAVGPAPKEQGHVLTGDRARANRAQAFTLEMDLPGARGVLEGADPADAALAIERARLMIYAGDYDGAAKVLERPDLAATDEGAELGDIARGSARGMAATLTMNQGIVEVRLQDDDDRALVPLLADVAVKVREQLVKDLGVELPAPLRIDLVRDQFTLAAMTGLPEEAARTTGTVAIAKWGRVTMISPRATDLGYPWLDTLAHEMTHLALTSGTRDKAPLWLQEGVAKREETRWRDAQPHDDFPSADAIAVAGIEKGLGRPLDKLGPSIAMLPTPEQAQVAFAEVSSFIRFWTKDQGDQALPKLVVRIKALEGGETIDKAVADVSGADLAAWDKRWRAHLASVEKNLPPDLAPGAAYPHMGEIARHVRLGELLHDRGHEKAASIELEKGMKLAPFDASVRCYYAEALLGLGDTTKAAPLVEKIADVHSRYGRWWSLHGLFFDDPPKDLSFAFGIAQDPLDPHVACEEKHEPELPNDAIRAAVCEAARRAPR
jgi:hypothetical protein